MNNKQNSILDEVKRHKHIILAFDHYNTLGVLRSLALEDIHPIVILYGKNIHVVPKSRYITTLYCVETVEQGYKLLIDLYGSEKNKPFLYSCDDFVESYLDERYNEVISRFFFFDGGKPGIITNYMNKEKISNLAEECGARVPKTEKVKRGELPKSLRYPVITKTMMSIQGAWKNDYHICFNEMELNEAYKSIKAENLLVEEYITKKNELCLDGFCVNHGEEVCIPFQSTYLRVAPGKYGNYMTLELFKNDHVLGIVKKILQKSRFNGIFSVEFLIDQNSNLFFLEVNFRNSTWSWAYTKGGVNMPVEWAKATLLGHIDWENIKPRTTPFKAMAETPDFRDFVRSGKIRFTTWLRELYQCDCLFFYDKHDPKPAFSEWWYLTKNMLKNRIMKWMYH